MRQGFTRTHHPASHRAVADLPHLSDQEYPTVSGMAVDLVGITLRELEFRLPAMQGYTELQRQHAAEDLAHIVDHLITTLYVGEDGLFVDFITWTADVLAARGVPAESLHHALDSIAKRLLDFPRASSALRAARTALESSHVNAERPL